MATIKNEDLEIMINVEHLLHKKLEETNGIKDVFEGKDYYYFDENDKEYEIWVKYWNMVERFCQDKDRSRQKVRAFNKNNSEYHRLNVNLYAAKKSGNKERLEYWQNEMKKYKETKGGR